MAMRRKERRGLVSFILRWVRRIQRVLMILSIAAAVYRWWQSRQGGGASGGGGGGSGRPAPIGGPSAPSLARSVPEPTREPELVGAGTLPQAHVGADQVMPTSAETRNGDAWVPPLGGGECPVTHPIKANETSGIFHSPGGRFYARTEAVRCYRTAEAAAADGYRASKA
jgi:hypothetical protein